MFCFLYLLPKVFPDLRVWCEKRRLHLVDCDLRWVSNHGNRQQLPQIRYQAYELTTLFLHLFFSIASNSALCPISQSCLSRKYCLTHYLLSINEDNSHKLYIIDINWLVTYKKLYEIGPNSFQNLFSTNFCSSKFSFNNLQPSLHDSLYELVFWSFYFHFCREFQRTLQQKKHFGHVWVKLTDVIKITLCHSS